MSAPSPSRWMPEDAILKSVDVDSDNDTWPIFALTNAVIYKPDGTTMANALLVNVDGPFVVRGRLDIEDREDLQYLQRPNVRSADIQIDASIKYSIGYDPLPVVWVSGKSGWFEINPHPSYAAIYKDMCDVSVLVHRLMDIYENAASKRPRSDKKRIYGTLDIKDVLFEYAIAVGDGITFDELVDNCIRLAPLLLAHFSRTDDLVWKSTSFYKWLTREVKDRVRSERATGRAGSVADSPSQAASAIPPPPRSASSLSQDLPLRNPRPRSETAVPFPVYPPAPASASSPQPPTPTEVPAQPVPPTAPRVTPVVPPAPSVARTPQVTPVPVPLPGQAASLPAGPSPSFVNNDPSRPMPPGIQPHYANLLDVVLEIGKEYGDVSRMSQSTIHGKFFNKLRIRQYATSKDVTAYFASQLLESLDPVWAQNGFGIWLRQAAAQPFQPTSTEFDINSLPQYLTRRQQQTYTRHPRSSLFDAGLQQQQKMPSTPRTAGKAPPGSGPMHPLTSGKRASLRPPTSSKKRQHDGAFGSDAGVDSDGSGTAIGAVSRDGTSTPGGSSVDGQLRRGPGRPRKIIRSDADEMAVDTPMGSAASGGHLHGADIPVGNDDYADDDDEDDYDDDDEYEEDVGMHGDEDTVLTTLSEPLIQSTAPTGPNRTWKCPKPGCPFFVRDAAPAHKYKNEADDADDSSSDDDEDDDDENDQVRIAQQLIRQHIRDHDRETMNKVNLAISEGTSRHLSVNHLLDKIRSLSDAKGGQATHGAAGLANGTGPRPIARQFLV